MSSLSVHRASCWRSLCLSQLVWGSLVLIGAASLKILILFFFVNKRLNVSFYPKRAAFGGSNRYQLNRSLHTSNPVFKSTHTHTHTRVDPLLPSCVSRCVWFTQQGMIDCTSETKHSAPLSQNHDSWVSVGPDCETSKDFSWRLGLVEKTPPRTY